MRDTIFIQEGNTLSLTVEGPEAEGVPADMSNLALRAVAMVSDAGKASLSLEKHLPTASGIGGGSADAAAAARGMLAFESRSADLEPAQNDALLSLGADIPMCLHPEPCRVRGIGELIEPVIMPGLPAVLINPRVPVHTPDVFRGLAEKDNPPMPETLPDFEDETVLIDWLSEQRNDLEAPAIAIAPVIAEVLTALRQSEGCRLARMSGSGATCFGIFESYEAASLAARELAKMYRRWWIKSDQIGGQYLQSLPLVS